MDQAQAQQAPTQHAQVSPKSRLVALLLCWFFGIIGVHRFYVGKIGTGILRIAIIAIGLILGFLVAPLLLTAQQGIGLIAFFIWPLALGIVIIWNIVDLILIIVGSFKDKSGLPLKKWTD